MAKVTLTASLQQTLKKAALALGGLVLGAVVTVAAKGDTQGGENDPEPSRNCRSAPELLRFWGIL